METAIYKRLTDRHRLVIDEYFNNGFKKKEAYLVGYPNCKPTSAYVGFTQLLYKDYVVEYYNTKYQEFKDSLSVTKIEIVSSLKKQIDLFDAMIELSLKDNMSEKEELKLSRLKDIVRGQDVMKAREMICRIMGVFEAEKVEIKSKTYSIGFDVD